MYAEEHLIGVVPKEMSSKFPIKDGETKFLSFDHEIRHFADKRGEVNFDKRHYSTSIKLFNDRIDTIEKYYGDAIQPTTAHELGENSGIADLQHVYPMGRTVVTKGDRTVVNVYAGASDAHTTQYEVDVMTLLQEMSEGSAQVKSGQVYSFAN
jgi:hypothetical protein